MFEGGIEVAGGFLRAFTVGGIKSQSMESLMKGEMRCVWREEFIPIAKHCLVGDLRLQRRVL